MTNRLLPAMRIATWNLEGKWSREHAELLASLDGDVLLLTEVRRDVEIRGYDLTWTSSDMQARRAWAAIASRIGLKPLSDPHPASAMAAVGGLPFCSSVLPWGGAGRYSAFVGASVTAMTTDAVACVERARPIVWGGDWNHSLSGREYVGSLAGRAAIIGALDVLELQVPTVDLPARHDGQLSIDHVAIPRSLTATAEATRVARRLSDHDAYAIEIH